MALCDAFRDYLLRCTYTIYTEYNPITYIFIHKKIPDYAGLSIELRWISALAFININIKYKAGHDNQNLDTLSRKSIN